MKRSSGPFSHFMSVCQDCFNFISLVLIIKAKPELCFSICGVLTDFIVNGLTHAWIVQSCEADTGPAISEWSHGTESTIEHYCGQSQQTDIKECPQ